MEMDDYIPSFFSKMKRKSLKILKFGRKRRGAALVGFKSWFGKTMLAEKYGKKIYIFKLFLKSFPKFNRNEGKTGHLQKPSV